MTDPHHEAVRRDNLLRARANADQPSEAPVPAFHNGRWTRRDWAQASLLATIAAMLAAIVPGMSGTLEAPSPMATTQRMTLSLSLPHLGKRPGNDDRWQSVTLKSGQTLSGVFEELGIPYGQLEKVMGHPKIKPALRKLRPGTILSFNLPADGSVRAMRFEAGAGIGAEPIELEFDGDALRERAMPVETSTRTVVLSGEVGDSLFASARKLGLGKAQLSQLTDEMFKYDIDFDSDLGAGDRTACQQFGADGALVLLSRRKKCRQRIT